MPEDALSTNLVSLRKDILAHFLDPLILECVSASVESPSTLVLTPVQPHQPLPSIRTLFHFICTQLLPHLPTAHQASFASSFYVPLTTSLTIHLLTPAIPNSVSRLPVFLTLIKDVVQLESEVSEMGFIAGKERRLFEWSQGARGHYERKRRVDLIEKARFLVLQPSRGSVKIEVEVETQGTGVVDLTEEKTVDVKVQEKPKPEPELEVEGGTTAWDFDEDDEKNAETKAEQNGDGDDDGWGFEEEGGMDTEPTSSTDVDVDDPWSQDWVDPNEVKPPSPPPPKQLVASAAAQKGQPSAPIQKKPRSMRKESYLVSQVATALASIAEDVLYEGSELLDSRWVT
jgi:centromere/kinetochore protein ZW10